VSDFIGQLKLEVEDNKQRETNEAKIELNTICVRLNYLIWVL